MNTFTTKLLIAASITLGLTTHSFAADIEAGVVKAVPDFTQAQIKYSAINDPLIAEGLNALMAERQQMDQTMGPAQGITLFEVNAVTSSMYLSWEPVFGLFSTTQDHGGLKTYVSVVQIGYGNIGSVSFPGTTPTRYDTNYFCGTSNLHICQVGETVVAWEYIYKMNNITNGSFNITASSIASPFGFWSDSVYIQ